jgi:hypothetical protein
VDAETRAVQSVDDYKYDERQLLDQVNIGKFGYGVDVKIGSNFTDLKPTNYNYMRDPYELRWKHIDEFTQKLNFQAIPTYNFKYYYYTYYYTYTANEVFQIDAKSKDWQEGTDCYSYIHTKASIVQRDKTCENFAEPYTITNQ